MSLRLPGRGKTAGSGAMERLRSDRELASQYARLRDGAALAERQLRDAQRRQRPLSEIRDRNEALDHHLGAALEAALAGQRAAMGIQAYDDRIARRKAMVRDDVRRWTGEISRLRTVRETFRLEAMGRTGTLVPGHVQIGTHAMLEPDAPGAEPGQPDDAAEHVDKPRVGVDLDDQIGGRHEPT